MNFGQSSYYEISKEFEGTRVGIKEDNRVVFKEKLPKRIFVTLKQGFIS